MPSIAQSAADDLQPVNILLVEDNDVDVLLLKDAFDTLEGFEHDLIHVQRLGDGLTHLRDNPVNVVLLDLGLPDSQGVDTFARLHRQAPTVPVLVLTALNDESVGEKAIEMGAEDYLVKNQLQPAVLARSVRYAIERRRKKSELEHVKDELKRLNGGLEQLVSERTRELEEANKELEAFSFSVSHDLRAPLRQIDGYSRLLLEDFRAELPAEAQQYLDRIVEGTAQMSQLIDDLLRFSRIGKESLSKRTIDMTALVREVWEELVNRESERNIKFHLDDLPGCFGDRSLIRQLLVNLLSNALKFTGNKRESIIEMGHLSQDGETVYFVRDNGVGFDMQYAEKLFQVFRRLHGADEFAGTGVGLSIVERIVHRHGGRIWAEGRVGEGATFSFVIPSPEGWSPQEEAPTPAE